MFEVGILIGTVLFKTLLEKDENKQLRQELEKMQEINKNMESNLLRQITASQMKLELAEKKQKDYQNEIEYTKTQMKYFQKRTDELKQDYKREQEKLTQKINKLVQNEELYKKKYQNELQEQKRQLNQKYQQYINKQKKLNFTEDTESLPQNIMQSLPQKFQKDFEETIKQYELTIKKLKKQREDIAEQQGATQVQIEENIKVYEDCQQEIKQYQNKIKMLQAQLQQVTTDKSEQLKACEKKIEKLSNIIKQQGQEIDDFKETNEAYRIELKAHKQKCRDLEQELESSKIKIEQEKKRFKELLTQKAQEYQQKEAEAQECYNTSQIQVEKQQDQEKSNEDLMQQLYDQENERKFNIEKTLINQEKQLIGQETQIKQFLQQIDSLEEQIKSLSLEKLIFQQQHEDLVKEFKKLLKTQQDMISSQQSLFDNLLKTDSQKSDLFINQHKENQQQNQLLKQSDSLKLWAYKNLFQSYLIYQKTPKFNLLELDQLLLNINNQIQDENIKQQIQKFFQCYKSILERAISFLSENTNYFEMEFEPFAQNLKQKISGCQNFMSQLKDIEKVFLIFISNNTQLNLDQSDSTAEHNPEQKLYQDLIQNLSGNIQNFETIINEYNDMENNLAQKFNQYKQQEQYQLNHLQKKLKSIDNSLNQYTVQFEEITLQIKNEQNNNLIKIKEKLEVLDQLSDQYYQFELNQKGAQEENILMMKKVMDQTKSIQEKLASIEQYFSEVELDYTSEVVEKQQQDQRIKQQKENQSKEFMLLLQYSKFEQAKKSNLQKLESKTNIFAGQLQKISGKTQNLLKLHGNQILPLQRYLLGQINLNDCQELFLKLQDFQNQFENLNNSPFNYQALLRINSVRDKLQKMLELSHEEQNQFQSIISKIEEITKLIQETGIFLKQKGKIIVIKQIDSQREHIGQFQQMLRQLMNFLQVQKESINKLIKKLQEEQKKLQILKSNEDELFKNISIQQVDCEKQRKQIDEGITQFQNKQAEKKNDQEKARDKLIQNQSFEIENLKKRMRLLEIERVEKLEYSLSKERDKSNILFWLKQQLESQIERFLEDFYSHLKHQTLKISRLQESCQDQRSQANDMFFFHFSNNLEEIKQYINSTKRMLQELGQNIKNKKGQEFQFEAKYLSERNQEMKKKEQYEQEIAAQGEKLRIFYQMIDELQKFHSQKQDKQKIIQKCMNQREQTLAQVKFFDHYYFQVQLAKEMKQFSDNVENEAETDFINYLIDSETQNQAILIEGV